MKITQLLFRPWLIKEERKEGVLSFIVLHIHFFLSLDCRIMLRDYTWKSPLQKICFYLWFLHTCYWLWLCVSTPAYTIIAMVMKRCPTCASKHCSESGQQSYSGAAAPHGSHLSQWPCRWCSASVESLCSRWSTCHWCVGFHRNHSQWSTAGAPGSDLFPEPCLSWRTKSKQNDSPVGFIKL